MKEISHDIWTPRNGILLRNKTVHGRACLHDCLSQPAPWWKQGKGLPWQFLNLSLHSYGFSAAISTMCLICTCVTPKEGKNTASGNSTSSILNSNPYLLVDNQNKLLHRTVHPQPLPQASWEDRGLPGEGPGQMRTVMRVRKAAAVYPLASPFLGCFVTPTWEFQPWTC